MLGDLQRLPIADETIDLVVCALALVHLPALGAAIAEFTRVLRPGGHLVISDIHVVSLYLGGVPVQSGADGRAGLLLASRYLASDYLAAALPLGLQVRDCVEPGWPASELAGRAARAASGAVPPPMPPTRGPRPRSSGTSSGS